MDSEEESEQEWDAAGDLVHAGGTNRSAGSDDRVILHFDLDCFYAQVEMIRNPALRTKPLGVQQKYIIVTCNYVARELGVSKMMTVKDALEKCPQLVLVNGEDLTYYREMSYKVTELLMSYCPLVERLGFDENFVDATEMVENRLKHTTVSDLSFVGHIYKHDVSSVGVQQHARLALGSAIAAELREAMQSRLGLSGCAGIATSKLLAKLVSGTFKPNQQTTLLPHSTGELMASLSQPSKVPGIGYRTNQKLMALGVHSLRDLQVFSLRELARELGEANAKRLQNLACGVDPSPVTPAGPPQSLSNEDSFKQISTVREVEDKIRELLTSLSERMCKDGRLPQTLRLTLRRYNAAVNKWFSRESKQCPIPPHTAHKIITGCPDAVPQLIPMAMKLFHKMVDVSVSFHLTLLNVCFSNLQNKSSSKNTISSLFTPRPPTSTHTSTQGQERLGNLSVGDATSTQAGNVCRTNRTHNIKEFFKHHSSSSYSVSSSSSPSSSFSSSSSHSVPSISQRLLQRSEGAGQAIPKHWEQDSDPDESRAADVVEDRPKIPPHVDPDVFRVLPKHIQMEIMSSYHVTSESDCANRPIEDDLRTQNQELCSSQRGQSDDESVARGDVPPNVDPCVFSQLPLDVQRELLTEWRQTKPVLKIPSKHAAKSKTGRDGRPASRGSQNNNLLKYFKPS